MAEKRPDELLLKLLSTMDEGQARWCVAMEAMRRGRGGLKQMHELTGISRPTILNVMKEVREGREIGGGGRIRRPGGGRKRVEEKDPGFERALTRIMDENTAGDPMSLLCWTNKSTSRIAEEMTKLGHPTSDETVRRRLSELG